MRNRSIDFFGRWVIITGVVGGKVTAFDSTIPGGPAYFNVLNTPGFGTSLGVNKTNLYETSMGQVFQLDPPTIPAVFTKKFRMGNFSINPAIFSNARKVN